MENEYDNTSGGITAIGGAGGTRYLMKGENHSLWLSVITAHLRGKRMDPYLNEDFTTPSGVASEYGSPADDAERDEDGNLPLGPLLNAEGIVIRPFRSSSDIVLAIQIQLM